MRRARLGAVREPDDERPCRRADGPGAALPVPPVRRRRGRDAVPGGQGSRGRGLREFAVSFFFPSYSSCSSSFCDEDNNTNHDGMPVGSRGKTQI